MSTILSPNGLDQESFMLGYQRGYEVAVAKFKTIKCANCLKYIDNVCQENITCSMPDFGCANFVMKDGVKIEVDSNEATKQDAK